MNITIPSISKLIYDHIVDASSDSAVNWTIIIQIRTISAGVNALEEAQSATSLLILLLEYNVCTGVQISDCLLTTQY